MKPWVLLQHSNEPARANGLHPLWLDLYEDDRRVDRITCCSGGPASQAFRPAAASLAGSFEPIPEGLFSCGLPIWVAGENNWGATWSSSLGPWVCDIVPVTPTERSELRVHMDWNNGAAPGTAGCIGLETRESGKRWLAWRTKQPEWIDLYVDYGLGIKLPPSKPPVLMYKAYLNEGRTASFVDGQAAPLDVRVQRLPNGELHVWRDGKERPAVSVRLEIGEKRL